MTPVLTYPEIRDLEAKDRRDQPDFGISGRSPKQMPVNPIDKLTGRDRNGTVSDGG